MSEPLHVYVSAVLRDRRKVLGIKLEEMARRVRSHHPVVVRVESGRHEITLSTIERYAAALNWTVTAVIEEAEHARDQAVRHG